MINKSYIYIVLVFLYLIKSSFSDKKIMIIEGDNLDLALKNAEESKYKLFLVFHVKNCPYCTHALKVLKNQIVKNYEDEDEIFFGSVDLDNQLNVWVGLRFNITKIPFIILIENKKMYHFESQFEESIVMKFISEEKNIEDGEDVPGPVGFKQKFNVAVDELTERMQIAIDKIGLKLKWNMTMTYAFIIFLFVFFFYIENKIIHIIKNFFNFRKNNSNLNEKENKDKKEQNKDQKEKEDKEEKKKIKKE